MIHGFYDEEHEEFRSVAREFNEREVAPHYAQWHAEHMICLLYTSPSPRDQRGSRMPSSA